VLGDVGVEGFERCGHEGDGREWNGGVATGWGGMIVAVEGWRG
jgi:hypothetical protein